MIDNYDTESTKRSTDAIAGLAALGGAAVAGISMLTASLPTVGACSRGVRIADG